MMVGEHGIQTFEVVVVVLLLLLLSFDVFVLTSAHSLLFLDKWFVKWAQAWSCTQFHYHVGSSESDSKLYTNFEFCEGKKIINI